MNDLTVILDNVYNSLNTNKKINILEIGTGTGQNSTVILYNFFKQKNIMFDIQSYEGFNTHFQIAKKFWEPYSNVTIINEYFMNKDDIITLLLPNIPKNIIDYQETNERLKQKYIKMYLESENIFTNTPYNPDIIFIDCSRFMHLPIINMCYNTYKLNPDCIFIIEDDFYNNDVYGELYIIRNYFKLKEIKLFKKTTWQWPFVTFKIELKYNFNQ